MGGSDSESLYHPTTKPNTSDHHHHNRTATNILSLSYWTKHRNIYSFIPTCFLCAFFYLLGAWHHGATPNLLNLTTTTTVVNPLDFSDHHALADQPRFATGSSTTGSPSESSFPACAANYSEHTPCEDLKRSLKFPRNRLIYRERHCPVQKDRLKCRIPAPYGYRNPFKWPKSRDYAWFNNVPHKELTVEKAVQNWIRFEGDRFKFPGGGTMFPKGADAYIDDIGKFVNFKDGSIRTAIDTGCGVASFGAYLLSRNILTMSFAPRDTHEGQVQFALERGVPALIGVMASKRLPYPARSFDLAHCSRCLIPWQEYDGVYLMEVDRVLKPGGYWILSGPPIRWKKYWKGWERSKEDLNAEQTSIENVALSLCWHKVGEKDDIAVWQKPFNHNSCNINPNPNPNPNPSPPLCPASLHVDLAWYTNMEPCLTPLPNVLDDADVAGGKVAKWPERLNAIPPRIKSGSIKGLTPQLFQKDAEMWEKRVSYYKTVNNHLGKKGRYRNLLDMNANLGGFAAALADDPVWVMNVVPVEAQVDTLGVIYERGLIGTYQSWCEAMSTYPRTYDLIHADSIYTLYNERCGMEDILLEMDRILRPEGSVIFRDDVDNLVKMKKITDALKWDSQIVDHEDGPFVREKLLFAVKLYWTAPKPR